MATVYEIVSQYSSAACVSELKRCGLLTDLKLITGFLPDDCPISQRLWHVRNDKLFIIKCHNTECINTAKFNVDKCKYVCCSQSCKMAHIKQQNMLKHGVPMPSQVKNFAQKISTSLKNRTEKEVTEWADKRKQTNLLRYDSENVWQSDVIKSKIYASNQLKFGVKIPSQSELVKQKITNKMSEIDFSEIISRRRQTCLDKYGVDDVMKSMDVRQSVISTVNTKEFKEFLLNKRTDILQIKIGDDYEIINYNLGATCKTAHLIKHTLRHKCGREFEMTVPRIYYRLYNDVDVCPYCCEVKATVSNEEIKLRRLISSVYDGKIVNNFKQLISPYEVDVYLPDKQIAFEYNGLYWHNDITKDKDYHMMKTNMCAQNGVRLIHIWEHDWMMKRNIIESIIFGLFGKHDTVFARNCMIKDVGKDEYQAFCEANHLMGYGSATKCYGLYNDNELVEIMSFVSEKDNIWTISRLCSILYTTIVGGANRLFKHFLKNNKFTKIISYSDRSMFSGNVYKHLGMFMEKTTEPGYYMVNPKNYETVNRRTYLSYKSDRRLEIDQNFFRIYNSGNWRFVYTNQDIIDDSF